MQKKISEFKVTAPGQFARELTEGTLSLEYLERDGKRLYVLLFRYGTRHLYTGELLHGKSKIKRLGERENQHWLKTAQVMADPLGGRKVLTYVELSFEQFEDMEAFQKAYESSLEVMSQQNETAGKK